MGIEVLREQSLSLFHSPTLAKTIILLRFPKERCRDWELFDWLLNRSDLFRIGFRDYSWETLRGPWGKPYFAGPGLRGRLYYNVTHSLSKSYLALSSFPIGIDAENTQRDLNFPMLASRWFHFKERGLAAESALYFLRLWCRKESEAKLFGYSLFHRVGQCSLFSDCEDLDLYSRVWRRAPTGHNFYYEFKIDDEILCLASKAVQNIQFFCCSV